MTGLEIASLAIAGVGLVNCVMFCVGYLYLGRGWWYRHEHGWFLMLFIGCLGSLFALIISRRIFGDWPGRQWVTLAFYVSYVLATFWPTRLLIISYRKGQERKEE